MKVAVTVLSFCVAALLSLGLVMLYSSSMTQVGSTYLVKQLTFCTIGFILCVLTALVDYRVLKKLAWPLLGLASVLITAVLISTPYTRLINGAHRWIEFHGVRLQPSELAKLAVIVVLAWYGEYYQRKMQTFKRGIVIPGMFIAPVLVLIIREPDFGSTILLATICGALLLLAGVRIRYILPPIVTGVLALAWLLWHDQVRRDRILAFLNPEKYKDSPAGYQTWQSLIALGSGGWTGLGLGNGLQKQGFVPEHHTDFILSIIGEELGLIVTLAIVVAFVVIAICGFYIAAKARDTFGTLLATGLTLLISLQAAVNIGVVTSSLPNKGMPLPFISYGGSNLVVMLTCVGLLLSIARRGRLSEDPAKEPIEIGEAQTA